VEIDGWVEAMNKLDWLFSFRHASFKLSPCESCCGVANDADRCRWLSLLPEAMLSNHLLHFTGRWQYLWLGQERIQVLCSLKLVQFLGTSLGK
jgi:hypothetical protein